MKTKSHLNTSKKDKNLIIDFIKSSHFCAQLKESVWPLQCLFETSYSGNFILFIVVNLCLFFQWPDQRIKMCCCCCQISSSNGQISLFLDARVLIAWVKLKKSDDKFGFLLIWNVYGYISSSCCKNFNIELRFQRIVMSLFQRGRSRQDEARHRREGKGSHHVVMSLCHQVILSLCHHEAKEGNTSHRDNFCSVL